jgi:protein-disulfide isomerase
MKKLSLLLSLLLAAGLVYAQAPYPPADQPATAKADKAEKTQQVEAEVVAVDTTAKTITIKKDMAAEPQTLPVEGKAVTALKDVTAGQKYRLFCKNDTAGMIKTVVDIKKPTGQDHEKH